MEHFTFNVIFRITVLKIIKERNAVFTLPNFGPKLLMVLPNMRLPIRPGEKQKKVLIAFRLRSKAVRTYVFF
jgi:hypothetical protein